MMPEGERETLSLTETLDAPLDELLDQKGAATLSHSFFCLFRIPVRVFSESGAALARSGDEPELHRLLGKESASSQQLGLLYTRLKECELGDSGERTQRSFTGASYHVVAIGHGGKRVGRVVLGPFVEGELPLDAFRLALKGCADQETADQLAAELPRAKQDTVRSIGRHLVITLGLIVHESHQALLSARMHLASMRETQRETQRQQHNVQMAREQALALAQTRSGVVNEVGYLIQQQLLGIFNESSAPLSAGTATELSCQSNQAVGEVNRLCAGLIELSAFDSNEFLPDCKACSAEEFKGALQTAFKQRDIAVSIDVESDLPVLHLDSSALARCLGQLALRVKTGKLELGPVEIVLRKIQLESTESNVGALLFLGAKSSVDVELQLSFQLGSKTLPEAIAEALEPEALARSQASELSVTMARRVVEAHGGTVSVVQFGTGSGGFSVMLPS